MPNSESDYKQIFSELIKKQMLILGPQITLTKVKNVAGITVDASGVVTNIQGDPQVLLQNLINQFVELSGLIVKKTMESILTSYPNIAALGVAASAQVLPQTPPVHQEVTPPTQAPVEPIASPITMPSVEEIHKVPVQQPPSPVMGHPEVIQHVEQQVPTEPASSPVEPPVVQSQSSVQPPVQPAPQAPQTVATQNPAAMDDLSAEEVEKLNKMIQEMNQMDEKKQ